MVQTKLAFTLVLEDKRNKLRQIDLALQPELAQS
jgi:hypothetical protein